MKLILYAKKDIKTNVKNQSRNLDALLISPTFLPYIINKRDYSNKKHPSRMTVNYDRQNERPLTDQLQKISYIINKRYDSNKKIPSRMTVKMDDIPKRRGGENILDIIIK